MTVINFNQFKNTKLQKEATEKTQLEDSLNNLELVLKSSNIDEFTDLDAISEFIDETLTDEFLDPDIDISLNNSDYNKMIKLANYLPNNIETIVDILEKVSSIHEKYRENIVGMPIDEKMAGLILELECKAYQFSEFLNAFRVRYNL